MLHSIRRMLHRVPWSVVRAGPGWSADPPTADGSSPPTRRPPTRRPRFNIKLSVQGARTATLRAAAHAGGRPIRKSIMAERFMRRSRRYLVSPLTVVLVMMLVAVAPDQAYGPQAAQAGQTAPCAGRSGSGRARPADQAARRALQGAGRLRGHGVGDNAAAAQPDQHRHRSRRPHLGGRGRALPLASRPPARRRSHRRPRRTPTATARPTARTPSCRSRR